MPRTRNVQPRPEPAPQPLAKKIVKHPLQDITHRFVLISPSVNRLPIPKRKQGAEGSASGEKPSIAKAPALTSSLPPSSPLSTSSGFLQPESSHHVCPVSPLLRASDAGNLGSQFDFEPGLTSGGAQAVETESNDNLDPFGFLAVEKKLKTLRARKQDRQLQYRSLSPPLVGAKFEVERRHLMTPPTPHKKREKRRAVASPNVSSPNIFSVGTDSMPSTPSPSKPVSVQRQGNAVLEDEDNIDDDATVGSVEKLSMTPTLPARRKPAKKARKESTKVEESSGQIDGRRPPRRAAAAVKTVSCAGKGKEEGESKTWKKRGMINEARSRVTRQKAQAKGKARAAGNASCVDGGQQERRERERQERLDYFRKLEDYQMEKENVYVI